MVFDPFEYPQSDETFSYYKRLREQGPIIPAKHIGDYCMVGYEAVYEALRQPKLFSNTAWADPRRLVPELEDLQLPDSMIASDPPRHTKLRRIVAQSFSERSLASYKPYIQSLAEELVEALPGKCEQPQLIDFVDHLAAPLPMRVISDLLGVDSNMRSSFKKWSNDIIDTQRVVHAEASSEREARLHQIVESSRDMRNYLISLAQEKRARPEQDLLSRIVKAEFEGSRLTDLEVASFGMLLLVAGNETTTNLLSNAIRVLHQHSGVREDVLADAGLLPAFVNEVLRLESPAQAVFRVVTEDVDYYGTKLSKGQRVILLLGAANQDDAVFEKPLEFDLSRMEPNLAFGAGVHTCLGKSLAELEAVTTLRVFLESFPEFVVKEYEFIDSPFLRGHARMMLDLGPSFFSSFSYGRSEDLSFYS